MRQYEQDSVGYRALFFPGSCNGIAVGGLRLLVTPESFAPEEVRRLAVPLPSQGHERGFRVRRWLRETGGIGTRPWACTPTTSRPSACWPRWSGRWRG